ncbi:MAG: hypothetical protein QM788_03375 [Roseateles sp.]|uniref:hypothetical protein n=1 Tax=Roseateles sp. TaxID=1971397 RepID=UPI0039EA1AD9
MRPLFALELDAGTLGRLPAADAGDAGARNDVAMFFLDRQRPLLALPWLTWAAAQDHPDALHWLARLHIDRQVPDASLARGLMYLAQSAALGHAVSAAQVNALAARR